LTESLLNKEITGQVQEAFKQLKEPVVVLFFGSKEHCDYCQDTSRLVTEIAALSDKIELQLYDLEKDHAVAEQYRVDKTPTLIIAGKEGNQVEDYGVRIAGIPSGHEFSVLIHDLILVSSHDSGLLLENRQFLKKIAKPVYLQVFVTPT
jgi:alkyl hydroperoxide reductase subunit AhpF